MSKSIMIIDDEPQWLTWLTDWLSNTGVNYEVYLSLREAAAAIESGKRPHLIITDFHMGRQNGDAVARYIREEYPYIPVVLHSGDPGVSQCRGMFIKICDKGNPPQLINFLKEWLHEPGTEIQRRQ